MRLSAWVAACAVLLLGAPAMAETPALVPLPASVQEAEGVFALSNRTPVFAADAGARAAAQRFAELSQRTRGLRLTVRDGAAPASGASVAFVRDASVSGAEAYALNVTPERITVRASTDAGLFYGATTLWQLATLETGRGPARVPALTIQDSPRFAWRGLMVDSVRHFQSKEWIKRFIDFMAMSKFNVLHWHLTDDQGWRIEIKKYPRLTEVAAWRRPSGAAGEVTPRYGGFYTQDDIREVVAYAAARHITIVPEIEMPGHATAAIVAYPQLASIPNSPTEVSSEWGIFPYLFNIEDGTFTFLEDVLTEVMDLFPGAYIHVGGDEAVKPQWEANPAIQARMRELNIPDEHHLQSWFISRIGRFIDSKGRKMIGWDEILEGGIPPNATITSWRGIEGAVTAAQAGHDAVLSPWPYMYLDNRQSSAPNEAPGRGFLLSAQVVYEFNPAPEALTEAQRRHIIGLQANLWAEHMQTQERVEAKAFPRAMALAEAAWTPQSARSWPDFSRRLATDLARYDALGMGYDKPGLNVAATSSFADSGVNVALATPSSFGEIRYTTNGGAPRATSTLYANALTVPLGGRVRAQAFMNGKPLGDAQSWRFDANAVATRWSQQLKHCGDSLQLNFEDDAPRRPGAARAVFNVDVMRPCWIYEGALLTGVSQITAAVGSFPYSFQIGESRKDVTLRAPATQYGELEVRLGCEGERIAAIPLAPAAGNDGVTEISGAITPRDGRHDLCFTFTGSGIDPMYAIDWVRVGPPAR